MEIPQPGSRRHLQKILEITVKKVYGRKPDLKHLVLSLKRNDRFFVALMIVPHFATEILTDG